MTARIITVRWQLDPDAAFSALREASGRSHRRLHEVAAAVVDQQRDLGSEP